MNGVYVIVSGESGAGKTKLVTWALSAFSSGTRIISCTTRQPRDNEQQDIDYHFITDEQFQEFSRDGKFAECEPNIHGHAYGTLKSDIEKAQRAHQFVFHVVDVKGAKSLALLYPTALAFYITATEGELRGRLLKRGDTPEAIERRIARIAEEKELYKTVPFKAAIWNRDGQFRNTCAEFRSLLLQYTKVDHTP